MEGFWSTMRDDLVQSFGSSLTKVTPKTEIFPGDLLYHHGFGRIILVIGKSSENFVRERYDHTLVFKGVVMVLAPASNHFEVKGEWIHVWCPKNKLLRPFPREK